MLDNQENIKNILFKQNSLLNKLCSQTYKLRLINKILAEFCTLNNLNNDLKNNIIASSFTKNHLIIETSRSEYLSILRFNNQSLLYYLRQQSELSSIINIKYKINPNLNNVNLNKKDSQINTDNKNNNNNIKINNNTKEYLLNISNKISNQKLKENLLKLFNKF